MARNLPWSKDTESEKKESASRRGAKPARQIEVSRAIHDVPSKPQKSNPVDPRTASSKKRYSTRTPSTSPPPGPPEVETMIDGPNGDDVYIMVEDEFQEVAQSFTAHLHHAEYQRLKKKAKASPRKILAEPTSNMRMELKQQIRSTILKDKQRNAIKGIIPSNGGLGSANEGLSDDSIEDPWTGTALAGLMKNRDSQKTSLVGLERLNSGTRAEKGFGRPRDEVNDEIDEVLGDGQKFLQDGKPSSSPQSLNDGSIGRNAELKSDAQQATVTSANNGWKARSKSKAFDALLDNDSISIEDSVDDNHHIKGPKGQESDRKFRAKLKSKVSYESDLKSNEDEERKARLEEVPRFIF